MEQNVRVRAQGATRKGHPLQTKALGAMRPGSCDPKPNTRNKTITTQGGDQPSTLEGHSGFLEKLWPQTQQKGQTETTREKRRNTLAASRSERPRRASELKPRKFQENPKNARGPEWHPEKNTKRKDALPKWAINQPRRDKKEKTHKTKKVRCGCVLLLPALYLFKRITKNSEQRRQRKNPKVDRTNPKKEGLS